MLDSKMEPAIARDMVKGAPDTLHSEFRLGYSMLLNMMRGQGRMKAQELLAASFKQFQVEQALPVLQKKIDSLQVSSPVRFSRLSTLYYGPLSPFSTSVRFPYLPPV